MKRPALSKAIEIIAAVFILLFVYTATSKLIAHNTFLIALSESPLKGFGMPLISWLVPIAELLIAILLFTPRFRKFGLIGSLILMTLFTFYIVYMLLFSPHLPCSCGGLISKLSWQQHLWLNVFLTLLAATAIHLSNKLKFLLQ